MALTDFSASQPQLLHQLRRRKANLEKRKREFRVVQPRQLEPRRQERAYRKLLSGRQTELTKMLEEQLLPRLEAILSADRQLLPRRDALTDDVFVVINGVRIAFARLWPDGRVRESARQTGLEVSNHNTEQLNKVTRSTLSVELFRSEPWLQPQIENFVEQNVALIKSVDERYFGEVQEIVFRGARQGRSAKEIAEEIRERSGVSKSRAELIARDQVNKFNGQLSEIRQTETGVRRYRWRTSLDERVRPEHEAREGKVFEWDDPPADGHPGEAINCRCYAEPVLEDLINE